MAYEIPGFSIPFVAGADFSEAGQFRFVNLDATGKAVAPSAGGTAVGVRQNTPKAGAAVTTMISGVSIVTAGGVVTAGDTVGSDVSGRAVKAATGNVMLGRALETAPAAGVQIAVLLSTPGVAASA